MDPSILPSLDGLAKRALTECISYLDHQLPLAETPGCMFDYTYKTYRKAILAENFARDGIGLELIQPATKKQFFKMLSYDARLATLPPGFKQYA